MLAQTSCLPGPAPCLSRQPRGAASGTQGRLLSYWPDRMAIVPYDALAMRTLSCCASNPGSVTHQLCVLGRHFISLLYDVLLPCRMGMRITVPTP